MELKQFRAHVVYVSLGVVVSLAGITKGVHIGHLRITNVPFGVVWCANLIWSAESVKKSYLNLKYFASAQLVLGALSARIQEKGLSFASPVMLPT